MARTGVGLDPTGAVSEVMVPLPTAARERFVGFLPVG
jgi:hypothetical protein